MGDLGKYFAVVIPLDQLLTRSLLTQADLVNPNAQHILDTLEENRDWYHSMTTVSPPPDSSGMSSPGVEKDLKNLEELGLAHAAERIKFQITIDDPDQD